MRIGRGKNPKYISFIYGKEWDKSDFKFLSFRKTNLGWDFNVWRLMVSYDGYKKVKSKFKLGNGLDAEVAIETYHKVFEETGIPPILIGSKDDMRILGVDVAKKK